MKAIRNSLPLAAAVLLLGAALLIEPEASERLPRGDVAIDAAVAYSLVEGKGFWTPWERGSLFRPPLSEEAPAGFGHPADQHPPLWPLAGAAFLALLDCEPIIALHWASFTAHIVVLILLILAGRRLGLGAFAFLPALCYAVIGLGSAFSFNGSLYPAQAALYLAAALLMERRDFGPVRALLLGLVIGGAFLLNYQALLLVPAYLTVRFLILRRDFFRTSRLAVTSLVLISALAITLPWLIRNASLFGSPLYSVNPFYAMEKAGAAFQHQLVDGRLVLSKLPMGFTQMAKGWFQCAWFNIPYLLLLLVALMPGSAAILASSLPALRRDTLKGQKESLACAGVVILGFHLLACLFWPALKVRYLVPAAPLFLLLAWRQVLQAASVRKRWTLSILILFGLLCAAIYLKGSVHGRNLFISYLLSFLPMSLILLIGSGGIAEGMRSRLPALCLGLLSISAVGVLPGGAYYNVPPCPDFFGQDNEVRDALRKQEMIQVSTFLEGKGADAVMGEITLWHIRRGIRLVRPPLYLGEGSYKNTLETAARPFSIPYAVLDRKSLEVLPDLEDAHQVWQGEWWTIIDLNL